jgi:hypothetical protein
MKYRFNFGFFVSAAACAVILNSVNLGELKFAQHELAPLLQSDIRFRDQVAEKCGTLSAPSGAALDKFILERFPIPARPGTECTLLAHSSQITRFRLRSFWDFQVQVRNLSGTPVAERHFAVDFPTTLVLLPLVLFILALIFEFRRWGIGWTAASFVFLLSGGSIIQAFKSLVDAGHTVLAGEQSWTGMFLILFWVAICRARQQVLLTHAVSPEGKWLNRALIGAIGLWNPVALSLGGRLLLPFRGTFTRVAPFFSFQVLAVVLSVYLLTLGTDGMRGFFAISLWMPRYFTFGTLLFLFLQYEKPKYEPLVWHLPGIWRTLALVGGIELWAYLSPLWDGTSNITRIAIGLVIGQLIWPKNIRWRRVARDMQTWSGALLIGAFMTVLSTQSGVADLVLLALDPRMHPTGTVFFTFISGMALGFVTGGFAVAFFALFMAMMKTASVPLVHAALLDGVMAGILLSPFSVLNLMPAAQFNLSTSAVVAYRVRQLAFPLTIGLLIYAISAITSVAILRPATFLFLCLVAVVIHLKKASWKFGNYTITPTPLGKPGYEI